MEQDFKKVLFVGNGINRLIPENRYSWASLLERLKEHASNPGSIDLTNEFKPFTLSFEQIVFDKKPKYDDSVKVLKTAIKAHYENMPAGPFHKSIMESSFKHIVTTNYEYSLEKVADPNFETRYEEYRDYREEKTSLARKHTLDYQTTVWHIHGELDDKLYMKENRKIKHYRCRSILIGFEQYTYYLNRIRDFLYGDTGLTNEGLKKRLTKHYNNQDFQIKSWVDFFFVSDIHIIGFSFDFTETHLWWLLNKRNEMLRNEKEKDLVKNKIFYYFKPAVNRESITLGDQLSDIVNSKRQKATLDILKSLGVKCVETEGANHIENYQDALNKAEQQV